MSLTVIRPATGFTNERQLDTMLCRILVCRAWCQLGVNNWLVMNSLTADRDPRLDEARIAIGENAEPVIFVDNGHPLMWHFALSSLCRSRSARSLDDDHAGFGALHLPLRRPVLRRHVAVNRADAAFRANAIAIALVTVSIVAEMIGTFS
jgi:hypothetical protein